MPLEGVEEGIANLERFARDDWRNSVKAFEEVTMGVILPECMEECPVDTGTLRASIPAVSGVKSGEYEAIATIGAGGAASKYARRQHEDLTLHHPALSRQTYMSEHIRSAIAKYGSTKSAWFKNVDAAWSPNGTKAKFLEDPIMRHAEQIPRMVAERKVLTR